MRATILHAGTGAPEWVGSRRAVWVACALLVAAFAIWSRGLSGPYQFDDYATPVGDPASQSLSAWVGHLSVTLRPITKLTYALEAEAGLATRPAARRAVSIVLHAAAATLLFLLLLRLEPRLGPVPAGMAAAVWLAHPVHAESVLAVTGRTALLSGLFLLGALYAVETSRRWLSAALFVAACLARETALAGALPLVVAVASRPGARRARLPAVAPLLGGAAAALLWFLSTPRYLHLAEYSFLGRPLWKSFVAQVGAVPVGLGLLLRPSRLSIDYGVPLPTEGSDPLFVLGLLCYAAAGAGVVLLMRRARTAAIGLALWLAALLPTQSLVPKLDPLTNRPLSLALAGLVVALAPAVAALARHPTAPGERRVGPWLGRAAAAGAIAMVALIAVAAGQRASLYRSEIALWGDAASKSRSNARPHVKHAMLLRQQGRDLEAWDALEAARAIDPFSSGIAALSNVYRPREEKP